MGFKLIQLANKALREKGHEDAREKTSAKLLCALAWAIESLGASDDAKKRV